MTIDLFRHNNTVERAEIRSTRPLQLARLFEGKPVDDVLAMIPLLFTVCASAQSSAAANACAQALGSNPSGEITDGRGLVVLAENAREHVLRVSLDWPGFFNGSVEQVDLKPIMALPGMTQAALFPGGNAFSIYPVLQLDVEKIRAAINGLKYFLSSNIFGEDISDWLQREDMQSLHAWAVCEITPAAAHINDIMTRKMERSGDAPASFLPALSDDVLSDVLFGIDAQTFIAQPMWDEKTCETSVYSRQSDAPLITHLRRKFGAGLLPRLAARLVELAGLPDEMLNLIGKLERSDAPVDGDVGTDANRDGFGIAQVETARGRLVHAVQIEGDKVLQYRILAPTEWNFHPFGPAKHGLEELNAATEVDLENQANLFLTAIDPCVGYDLRIH